MSSTETLDHHGSHRGLLWPSEEATPLRDIDAIIVPTARRPAYLGPAAGLAKSLSCTLVTLHSKQWTSAAKAARWLPPDIDRIAIDVPARQRLRLPDWQTSELLSGTVFARRSDVSVKRNVALVLSRMLGWSRVMFLDDDITELNPLDVRRASGLLNTHVAVGLHVGGFPDHSVVCHAYLRAGGAQQSFIGVGALVVDLEQARSFFPDIYNDDWFFLLGDKEIQSVGVTGAVRQYPYDPFRTPDRFAPRSWATSSPKASTGCSTRAGRSQTRTRPTGSGSCVSAGTSSMACSGWCSRIRPSSQPSGTAGWPR